MYCFLIFQPFLVGSKALTLPVESRYLRCKNLNTQETISSISNFYQIDSFSYETQKLLFLLKIVAEKALYRNLRTTKRLVYIVAFRTYMDQNILDYKMSIESQETKFYLETIGMKSIFAKSRTVFRVKLIQNNI